MLVIDQAHNNGSVDLFVGDSFRVQLSENPTTGYRWHFQSHALPALRLIQDLFEASGSQPGSSGVRYWIFAADTPGSVELRLELRRSWQKQPVGTFAVTVSVKARQTQR